MWEAEQLRVIYWWRMKFMRCEENQQPHKDWQSVFCSFSHEDVLIAVADFLQFMKLIGAKAWIIIVRLSLRPHFCTLTTILLTFINLRLVITHWVMNGTTNIDCKHRKISIKTSHIFLFKSFNLFLFVFLVKFVDRKSLAICVFLFFYIFCHSLNSNLNVIVNNSLHYFIIYCCIKLC